MPGAGARLQVARDEAVESWLFTRDGGGCTEALLAGVRLTLADLARGYLWHRDNYNLFLPVLQHDDLPPHIYSLTYYGDNIEDEWFIIYLLVEITKKHPNLIAQVRDNDGEFLLIEAANALPTWASPDCTNNRVFILNGEIHLIPQTVIDIDKTISVTEAIAVINKCPQITRASENIQTAINKRIQNYPERIKENLHCATIHIPKKFAAILKLEPSLIAHAVNAYCGRDTVETNICRKIELENCIDTSVTFTKCLYAMLKHTSSISKPSWKLPAKSSPDYKKKTLGVKIACGFEILLSKASHDTFTSKQWKTYLDSLKKNGYFKDNIEGSNQYTKLLDIAKQFFLSNECSNINSHLGNSIKEIMTSREFEDISKDESKLHVTQEEDHDDWLNIDPEELNNLMSERYGKKTTFPQQDVITPQTITDQLSTFLKQSSDLEGIEVTNNDDEEPSNKNEDKIEFDFEQFTDTVKNILDFIVPEDNWNLDSGTDLSEYGSDDDFMTGMKEFKDVYQEKMEEELSNSTMAESFAKDGKVLDISKNAFVNLVQSVKEEMGSSGPSSNMLANIGISKKSIQPLLDSDDDSIEG